MKILIEKARGEDRAGIIELLKQANMHYIGTPEMPELTYDNYYVARTEEGIVGFCGFKILSAIEAKTELMVVDRRCRGHGVGIKLQTVRMEDMLARGIRTLTTNSDLPDTITWYKKFFGYTEVGRLKKIHEFGDPNIDHWTTLQVDLVEWDKNRKKANES